MDDLVWNAVYDLAKLVLAFGWSLLVPLLPRLGYWWVSLIGRLAPEAEAALRYEYEDEVLAAPWPQKLVRALAFAASAPRHAWRLRAAERNAATRTAPPAVPRPTPIVITPSPAILTLEAVAPTVTVMSPAGSGTLTYTAGIAGLVWDINDRRLPITLEGVERLDAAQQACLLRQLELAVKLGVPTHKDVAGFVFDGTQLQLRL